jgi:hypothetical protein
MRQKQLRIRIACLTVLASLSCPAVTFTQEQLNYSSNKATDIIAIELLNHDLLKESGQGRAAVTPGPEDQSFLAILNFAAKAATSSHVTDSHVPGGSHSIDLYTCGQVTGEVLPNDDPYFHVTDLAIWITQFSAHFKQEGTYDVAAPYLKRLTEYGVAETQRVDAHVKSRRPSSNGADWLDVNEALLERLAKTLNSAVHRKEYVVEGGCGAGEILVSVKIPAGSAAVLINTFHFTLCQARGTDPWNAQGCYGWKTVRKIPMMLSGAYRYVLNTADGQKKIGDVLVDKKNGGDMDHPLVLSLK